MFEQLTSNRNLILKQMSQKTINILGWIATATSILMYFSYIDSIRLNLAGQKGSVIQPAVAVLNCLLWICYGCLKPKRDWPIVIANVPGVILGSIAFFTAY
jgi:hypothetical protein